MHKISVVGMGKLGLCIAACFATKGYKVIGIDNDPKLVQLLKRRQVPFYEPHLEKLLMSIKRTLYVIRSYEDAIAKTDITFLVVPTPSAKNGTFSNENLRNVLANLSIAFKKIKKKYHLFVITSTVSPGAIWEKLVPCIETISGKKIGREFGVCYNPAFVALGSVIYNFLHPDLILIGASDNKAGEILKRLYTTIYKNKPQIFCTSIVNAEIAKISLNSYITMKISFANMLANICELIPGADVDVVTEVLGADKRVGRYCLKGGLGYGGPCFPRDNKAFIAFAARYGYDAKVARAVQEINKFQHAHLAQKVLKYAQSNKHVSVIGIAYKPHTAVIEESAGIYLIEALLKRKIKIVVYDELAIPNLKRRFGKKVQVVSSIKECFQYAPLCVIASPDNAFKKIDNSFIIHNPTVIIDCWRLLDTVKFDERVIRLT